MRTQSLLRSVRLVGIVVLLIPVYACGLSKPDASDYIGAWTGSKVSGCDCLLDVSPNGTSFVVRNVTICAPCRAYEGIYTLTDEGILSGGAMGAISLSYDKQKKQAAFSPGSGLQYLKKIDDSERRSRVFEYALESRGFARGEYHTNLCTIDGSDGPCRVEAFVFGELSHDPAARTCAKLDKARYVGECKSGTLNGLSLVIADGSAKASREAFVAYFSGGLMFYPALTSFVDGDVLNLGVQEFNGSYGCVYFGKWDDKDKRKCALLSAVFGEDILSEANAVALKRGSFDVARYQASLERSLPTRSKTSCGAQ